MGRLPQSDGGYAFWLVVEVVPGLAAGLHDVVVSCEDGIGQKGVAAQELPDVFDGVHPGLDPGRDILATGGKRVILSGTLSAVEACQPA